MTAVPPADYGREVHDRSFGPRDHAALSATATIKVYKCPQGRRFRVDRVTYLNVTGLAQDNTNSFAGQLKNGTTVVAAIFDTGTGGAAIPANTTVEGTLSATDGNRVLAEGEELSIVFTKTGTQTLPIGSYIVEGRLL